LRDLVAISAIPAAWVGRTPHAIATGFADVLIRSLHLNFVFVRLFDPKDSTPVDVIQGDGWREFPQWLQRRLADGNEFAVREIVSGTGGDARQSRGMVIPIGVNAQSGLVAAACYRADFPCDIDQLLLSIAANHAATAFQNARLIEERRRAEQTLRHARDELEIKVQQRTTELSRTSAELATILAASPVGIALFGCNQTVQRCNPAYARILGWNADEIVGLPIPIASGNREQWSALAEMLTRAEAFANVEIRLRRKDGTEFDASIACAPFGNDPTRPAGFVGTIEDISERKRSEEALRRSEAYLAEAQRLSHTGSWVWNVATRQTVHWSHEQYRLFGFDPYSGVPSFEAWLERVHPEDRARIAEALRRVVEGMDFELDYRAVLPDGAIRYIRTIGRPALDSSGETVRYIGTSMDMTKRKQAEDAMRQAQTDLAYISRVTTMGELTASLAHEIKQPIAAAATNANACVRWLLRGAPNLEEAREAASRAAKDTTRAADIVNRISSLFKKEPPRRDLIDINELINEIVLLLGNEATRYSVSIRTELASGLPVVVADRVQVQQVLMNLMINSIEAMKAVELQRELTLCSQRDGTDRLRISVSDTGVGLPPAGDRIFNAFYTTKPDGTGMGLAISRSIIEAHGGHLYAAPRFAGGATFYFTLPTSPEP
jgi:PAS domain S-box-containing protein